MALSQSDAAKMEQIITEFFAKSLHIILESRTPSLSSSSSSLSLSSSSSSSSSSVKPRDKWFNLALKESPAALEKLNLCSPECMVVDVILVEKLLDFDFGDHSRNKEHVKDTSSSCGKVVPGADGVKEKIIERWVVQYELQKNEDSSEGRGTKKSNRNILSSLYKKSMLLLRSLYATVRLLPAYKVFRQLNLSGHLCSCFLAHRVSSSTAEPFSHRQKAEMQLYGFTPLDTSSGKLCLSVLYLSKLSDVAPQTSTSMSHMFIKEYIGSSMVDPVKRFYSFSGTSESQLPQLGVLSQSGNNTAKVPPSFRRQSLPNFTLLNEKPVSEKADALVGSILSWAETNKIPSRKNECGGVSSEFKIPSRILRPPRPSPQDGFGRDEMSCAFDVDGDHPRESGIRNSNLSVGPLVDMLQKAQPLGRESSSSGKKTLKTTADAMTDLAGFIELKNSLVSGDRTPRSS